MILHLKKFIIILSLFKDTYILNIHRIQYNDALKYHIDKQTTKEYINLSIGTNFPRQITFSIKSNKTSGQSYDNIDFLIEYC